MNAPTRQARPLATLSATQRADLQTRLSQRRAELQRQLALQQGEVSRVEHAAEVLTQDGDDAPQRDADREVDLARNDQQLLALAQVDEALARLADTDFGQCGDCGEAIAWPRLQLAPWVRHCVACESARERQQHPAGVPAHRL